MADIDRLRESSLFEGLSDEQVCARAKVWYRKREFMRLIRQSSTESLRRACKELMLADRAVKTGASTVRNAVEKFIWSLAAGSTATQTSKRGT